MKKDNLIWYCRKRLWCRLPWTFTKYGMSEDRLFVESGILNTKEQEVRLYRVMNVNLNRSFLQRIFGLGTIHIDSSDKDLNCYDIKNVINSQDVKELISETVEKERLRNRVTAREYMTGGDHDMDDVEGGLFDDMSDGQQ